VVGAEVRWCEFEAAGVVPEVCARFSEVSGRQPIGKLN
jgi:hypothetical protein